MWQVNEGSRDKTAMDSQLQQRCSTGLAGQRVRKLKPLNSMMTPAQPVPSAVPSNQFTVSFSNASAGSAGMRSPTYSNCSNSPPTLYSAYRPSTDYWPQSTEKLSRPLQGGVICNFCKGNGESRGVFTGHRLRDDKGNLTCPILRRYICPQCGSTGDTAHTLSYCPWAKEDSVAKAIRQKTGRNSAGNKKF